jgi:hypothetical protein
MSSESCQFSYFAFSKSIEAFSSNPNDLKTGLISALLDATTFRARHFKTSTQSNSGFSITESAYTSGLNNGFSILIAFHRLIQIAFSRVLACFLVSEYLSRLFFLYSSANVIKFL